MIKIKKVDKHSVGKCYICKQEHFRENTEEWVYHVSIGVVCKKHPGVMSWYSNLLKNTKQELEEIGITFPQSEVNDAEN